MSMPTEKLPLQFYIQRFQPLGAEDMDDENVTVEATKLNEDLTDKLKTVYQGLWIILHNFAAQSRANEGYRLLTNNYLFEKSEIAGHPNVHFRCEMVEEKGLAFILEQSILVPTFAGRAGLILGAHGSGKSALLREWHAHPIAELDLLNSQNKFHVYGAALQSYADVLLAQLISHPSEIARVRQWFQDTEKVISVPEESLRETTKWLKDLNHEIASERRTSEMQAESQNKAFMRLFASLADPRVGA